MGNQYESTVKLIIQGQGNDGTAWRTHSCEVLLVRQTGSNIINHVTYAVVYTGSSPLFTVSSSVDSETFETVLEVTNLNINNLYISTFTTVLGSYD
jgi:hypothetical protein